MKLMNGVKMMNKKRETLVEGMYRRSKEFKDTPDEPDMVNHPPHYTRGKVETIDALESAVEGLEGKEAGLTWNVIKYMWRWKFKGNPLQDLRKAEFYLKRLIKHVEEEG